VLISTSLVAADALDPIPSPLRTVADLAREESRRHSDYQAWKLSLAPVAASQVFDAASSHGMRELNPLLASQDGRFGMQAAGIKFGATAAILGLEYWLVKKHPGSARILSKLNWTSAAVTTGFAFHNFAIR
jgi:hypothetical protein